MIHLKKILYENSGPPSTWDNLDTAQKQHFINWWKTKKGVLPSKNMVARYYADMKNIWWKSYQPSAAVANKATTFRDVGTAATHSGLSGADKTDPKNWKYTSTGSNSKTYNYAVTRSDWGTNESYQTQHIKLKTLIYETNPTSSLAGDPPDTWNMLSDKQKESFTMWIRGGADAIDFSEAEVERQYNTGRRITWWTKPKEQGGWGVELKSTGAGDKPFGIEPGDVGSDHCGDKNKVKYTKNGPCEYIKLKNEKCDMGLSGRDPDDYEWDPIQKRCIYVSNTAGFFAWAIDNWPTVVGGAILLGLARKGMRRNISTRAKGLERQAASDLQKGNEALIQRSEAWAEAAKTSEERMLSIWKFKIYRDTPLVTGLSLYAKDYRAGIQSLGKEAQKAKKQAMNANGVYTELLDDLTSMTKSEYLTQASANFGKSINNLSKEEKAALLERWETFKSLDANAKLVLGQEAVRLSELGYLSLKEANMMFGADVLNQTVTTSGGIEASVAQLIKEKQIIAQKEGTFQGFQAYYQNFK